VLCAERAIAEAVAVPHARELPGIVPLAMVVGHVEPGARGRTIAGGEEAIVEVQLVGAEEHRPAAKAKVEPTELLAQIPPHDHVASPADVAGMRAPDPRAVAREPQLGDQIGGVVPRRISYLAVDR